MAKTIISAKWDLIPLEQKKLAKSALYGMLAVLTMALSSYLQQYGLPEQFKYLAPLLPVVINFLTKWAGQNTYKL